MMADLFFRQVVSLGEDTLELFHAPGHSPGSACIRIGNLLFIGDLLAAVNPMVAGITGWSREDFIVTLDHLTRLLSGNPALLCCPGHGGIMTAAQTLETFGKIRAEAVSLGDPEEMNPERLHFTTEYALDLIGEAEEVFSAVAGRLYYVSYWLEELDEGDAAARFRALAETDPIDACLADFRSLAAELNQGKRIEVEFACRSLGIIQKIHRLFDLGALENLLPRQLLNRATRLMMDFIRAAKGIRSGDEVIYVDLNDLTGAILDEFRKDPHADDAIMELTDDREAFVAALAGRIASAPLFEGTETRLEPQRPLPLVRLDPARFGDALTDLLGHLAVGGAKVISLATGMDDAGVFLKIVPGGDPVPAPLSDDKTRLFARRFGMCRAVLKSEDRRLFVLHIPV